jgi:hypothetical protein
MEMNDLRTAAQQALEALELLQNAIYNIGGEHVTGWGYANDADSAEKPITDLRAALAEPVQEPVAAVAKNATAQFDHAIGADRFKVVRGAFWWHVLIGDSTKEHGKFHSRAGAEQMAADLLREFRNGAFVQHTAPPQRDALLEALRGYVNDYMSEDGLYDAKHYTKTFSAAIKAAEENT